MTQTLIRVQSLSRKRSDIVSGVIITLHLLIVLSPLYIAAILPLGFHLILAWLFFGLSMNGILNLMHECCHNLVFQRSKNSELLGKYIGLLAFADFDSYRHRHWQHHHHLGQPGDTKDAYLIDIRGKNIFIFLLKCLSMQEAVRKFCNQLKSKKATTESQASSFFFNLVTFQVIFFISLVLASWPIQSNLILSLFKASLIYIFVYLYGLMSLTVFTATLRAIAEHQISMNPSKKQGFAALRNFKCNAVTRFLMGAYGFGDHYTHHQFPTIPYYNLPTATIELEKSDSTYKPTGGYLSTLYQLIV